MALNLIYPLYDGAGYSTSSSAAAPYREWQALSPYTTLVGASNIYNSWQSDASTANQTLHINLGVTANVAGIYYENSHNSGTETDYGVKNFTLWGSNTLSAFTNPAYATDTNWTQLTTSPSTFDQHSTANAVDPKFITVTNSDFYQYYRFKFVDNYGDASWIGVRKIVLQKPQDLNTPDYGNPLGRGARATSINLAINLSTTGTSANILGQSIINSFYWNGAYCGTKYCRFDFGAGKSKVIKQVKYSQQNATTHGTFIWQGSNDAAAWANIGTNFVLATGATASTLGVGVIYIQNIDTLTGNTTGYRYYQMLGTTGNMSDSPYVYLFEFQIADYAAPSTGIGSHIGIGGSRICTIGG